MTNQSDRTTWDGKPIASSPPFGATIVLYRADQSAPEFLILHRAHQGPDYEGDWAWTPPSGARYPGEAIENCARRELLEETGLRLELTPIKHNNSDWVVYLAEMSEEGSIELSDEHDRYAWVPLKTAMNLCKPDVVSRAFLDSMRAINLTGFRKPD